MAPMVITLNDLEGHFVIWNLLTYVGEYITYWPRYVLTWIRKRRLSYRHWSTSQGRMQSCTL